MRQRRRQVRESTDPAVFGAECMFDRIYAQFKHLGETFFDDFEHDLGERELGYALSFDHDLDMFAAAVGLSKTQVASTLKDEGLWYYTLVLCHF
jgi:hypothetical protein